MKNPFAKHKLRHYALVFDDLQSLNGKKFFDYGTGNSEFISKLRPLSKSLYAFDVDKENVERGKKKYPYISYKHNPVGVSLPYKPGTFDAIFMFHVLEHVDSEQGAIDTAYRLLKKGGRLYLASPYDGLFSWADTANLRYRFPTLHRVFMEMALGKEVYNERFINKADQNLFGDCSANRKWHTHYKKPTIIKLLSNKFVINEFLRFSLFHPFLLVFDNIWNHFNTGNNSFTRELLHRDNTLDVGEWSYNFLVIAEKK